MRKITYLIVVAAIVVLGIFLWNKHSDSSDRRDVVTKSKTNSSNDKPVMKSSFDKHKYSLNSPTSQWVIVNKQNPLEPKDYAPSDLVSVGHGQQMRSEAASALRKMIAAAGKSGLDIYAASAYRSYDTQVAAYDSEVKAFGEAYADQESARPGYSEHQSGWAVDLGTGQCSIANCFATTPAGKWVAANAYKYGFLLRYPKGCTNVTGYEYESWHYRYIGTYLSNRMHQTGTKTLEQFFGLPNAPTYD